MRRSDLLAESVGISRYRTKLTIYTLSGIPCGIAGALFVYSQTLVLPSVFSVNLTILFLAGVVLGGARRFYAPLIGVAILQGVSSFAVSLQSWELLVYGVFLLVIPLAVPGGVVATVDRLWRLAWEHVPGGAALRARPARTTATEEPEELVPLSGPELATESVVPSAWRHSAPSVTLKIDGVFKAFAGLAARERVGHRWSQVNWSGSSGATDQERQLSSTSSAGSTRPIKEASAWATRSWSAGHRSRWRAAGVGRTFQTPHLPEDVTVIQSIVAAFHWRRKASVPEYMLRLGRSRGEQRVWLERAQDSARSSGHR